MLVTIWLPNQWVFPALVLAKVDPPRQHPVRPRSDQPRTGRGWTDNQLAIALSARANPPFAVDAEDRRRSADLVRDHQQRNAADCATWGCWTPNGTSLTRRNRRQDRHRWFLDWTDLNRGGDLVAGAEARHQRSQVGEYL